MSPRWLFQITFGLGIILSGTQAAGSQQLDAIAAGFRRPVTPVVATQSFDGPRALSLVSSTLRLASLSALAGGAAGLGVDQAYCEQHHGDEPAILFGPCFLYTGAATTVGWFGGAVVGATVGAMRAARKRGCPTRMAAIRALAGAALGAAPGLFIVAGRPGKYPPAHTALVAGAPLFAGAGAAALVAGCRG